MVYSINYFIFAKKQSQQTRTLKPHIMEKTHPYSQKRRRFARRFARRILSFTFVCAFLAFVNRYTTPGYWWVLWVMAGWGLSLALSLAFYLFDCAEDGDDDSDNR